MMIFFMIKIIFPVQKLRLKLDRQMSELATLPSFFLDLMDHRCLF